jgi:uncharacterized protein YndB with AHSA1/START domain
MTNHLEVSRKIAAPPDVVWAAVSDVTRMGEWSPECHSCEWQDGATGPAVGAVFAGHNRNGDHEWTTESRVVECVPGERFVFEPFFGDLVFARWGYLIEADGDGSLVTETWDDLRPESIIEISQSISGVEDRAGHNQDTMAATLEGLARAVE